jgi:hypothetical protein
VEAESDGDDDTKEALKVFVPALSKYAPHARRHMVGAVMDLGFEGAYLRRSRLAQFAEEAVEVLHSGLLVVGVVGLRFHGLVRGWVEEVEKA